MHIILKSSFYVFANSKKKIFLKMKSLSKFLYKYFTMVKYIYIYDFAINFIFVIIGLRIFALFPTLIISQHLVFWTIHQFQRCLQISSVFQDVLTHRRYSSDLPAATFVSSLWFSASGLIEKNEKENTYCTILIVRF